VKPIRQWPKATKITLIVLASYIVVFAPGFVYSFAKLHEVKKAFRGYSDQLIAADYEKAYDTTGPQFQAAISKQDFIAQQTSLCSHHGSLEKVSIGSAEIEVNEFTLSATLNTTFKYERSAERFDFVMKRYDGRWQIYGYKEQ
jgi:hypothetical protein